MRLRPCEAKCREIVWLKSGENRRNSIKNQSMHSDSASNVDEKWLKKNNDVMYSYRVIALASSKQVLA